MYISRVYIKNYRNFENFDLFIPDGSPLTVIGSNNSGKTNFLQAIRLVLDSSMSPWEKRLKEEDFCWEKEENCWSKGEEIVITITFSNVSDKEEIRSLLYSIAPQNEDGLNESDDALEANISFVFTPSTVNKENLHDISEDYIGFLVTGRYHPSGYYYLSDGSIKEYDKSILSSLHACENKEYFYKYFYLSEEDIEKLRENPKASFEKQISKQLYANKIRKHINLLSLDALRDVKNDFHQGYHSLVSQLIRGGIKTNSNNKVAKEISDAFSNLRSSGVIPEANQILDDIEHKLQNEKVNLLSSKADLIIGTPKVTLENIGRYFNFLVNLKEDLKMSQDMDIVGLGYQNLAYISAIFALFELKKEIILSDTDETVKIIYNLLLIEEPESHLDVQNQKYLHTQIENKTQKLIDLSNNDNDGSNNTDSGQFYAFTQVIQTSHSTHLASKSDLKNLVVLQKGVNQTKAVNIDSLLQRNPDTYGHNRRILKQYLDATRSSLLFAQKVILVEGLSEKYVLGTIVNSYLREVMPESTNTDIDSEGIEIVEVGGKIFNPFNSLFNNDITMGLNNKCLNLRDGDSHLEEQVITDYKKKYEELNASPEDNSLVIIKRNIYTFEIDCFFLPDPANLNLNNLDYLKLILARFMEDGDYFKQDNTFNAKITLIDDFAEQIKTKNLDKDRFEKFFEGILGHEVSKPSISLYLSSLLKAKLLQDQIEIKTWTKDSISKEEITSFSDLPDFIIPKYIGDGLSWLITKKN